MENMREELGDLCNNSIAYEKHDDFAPFNRNKPGNRLEKVFYKCICVNLTSALCTGILYTPKDDWWKLLNCDSSLENN